MASAIKFIIGGDATPFAAAMKSVERIASSTGKTSAAQLRQSVKEIESALSAASKSGKPSVFLAEALRQQVTELNRVEVSAQAAAKRLNDLAAAQARSAMAAKSSGISPSTVSGASLSDRTGPAARVDRRLDAMRQQTSNVEKNTLNEIALKRAEAEEQAAARIASVDAATRANRARALRAERAAERAASQERAAESARAASVEASARANRARALLRERAERRVAAQERIQEELRVASVETATRANRARALRAERAEQRSVATREKFLGPFAGIGGGLVNRFLGVGAAIGAVYAAIRTGLESIQANITMQRISNAFTVIKGSAMAAREEIAFFRKESERIGTSFQVMAEGGASFTAAGQESGMKPEKIHEMITAISQMGAVLGLTTERQREALLAIEQMMSKGQIMAQELKLQFGNAVPGGLNIFSKALGVTNQQLYQMMEDGTLLAQDVLPKVSEYMLKAFPLTENANKEARNIERLKNEIFLLKAELGKGLSSPTLAVVGFTRVLTKVANQVIEDAYDSQNTSDTSITAQLMGGKAIGEGERGIRSLESKLRVMKAIKAESQAELEDFREKPKTKQQIKDLEEIERLNKQIKDQEQHNAQEGETKEEKRLRLLQEIKTLEYEIKNNPEGLSEVQVQQMRLDKAKAEGDLGNLDRDKNSHGGKSLNLGPANEMERANIGLGLASPNMVMLDVSKQSLAELREINKKLGGSGSGRGVIF